MCGGWMVGQVGLLYGHIITITMADTRPHARQWMHGRPYALVEPRVDERANDAGVVHGDGAAAREHQGRLPQGAAGLLEEGELLLAGQLLAVAEVLDALHHLRVVLLHQLCIGVGERSIRRTVHRSVGLD